MPFKNIKGYVPFVTFVAYLPVIMAYLSYFYYYHYRYRYYYYYYY